MLGDEGLKDICVHLPANTSLIMLMLKSNSITQLGAKELATSLMRNKFLKVLDLGSEKARPGIVPTRTYVRMCN